MDNTEPKPKTKHDFLRLLEYSGKLNRCHKEAMKNHPEYRASSDYVGKAQEFLDASLKAAHAVFLFEKREQPRPTIFVECAHKIKKFAEGFGGKSGDIDPKEIALDIARMLSGDFADACPPKRAKPPIWVEAKFTLHAQTGDTYADLMARAANIVDNNIRKGVKRVDVAVVINSDVFHVSYWRHESPPK